MNVGDREGPSENLTKSYTLSLVMQLAKRQLFQAHIYNDQWCAPELSIISVQRPALSSLSYVFINNKFMEKIYTEFFLFINSSISTSQMLQIYTLCFLLFSNLLSNKRIQCSTVNSALSKIWREVSGLHTSYSEVYSKPYR